MTRFDSRVNAARGATRTHAEPQDTDRPISTVGDLPLSILG